ncbi:MAG: acyl carrier protein [Bacillota bacterium]
MQTFDMNLIKERVLDLVRKNSMAGSEGLCENSLLKEDLGIDSVRLVDLIVDLESELGFEVEGTALNPENFRTVSCVINYVAKKAV